MAAALTPEQTAFLRDNPYDGVVSTVAGTARRTPSRWLFQPGLPSSSMSTQTIEARARHIARDPRVTLIVLDPADAYHWVNVEGTADVNEEGADAQVDKLAKKYLGADTYPWRDPARPGVRIPITPERIETAGFDGDRALRGAHRIDGRQVRGDGGPAPARVP